MIMLEESKLPKVQWPPLRKSKPSWRMPRQPRILKSNLLRLPLKLKDTPRLSQLKRKSLLLSRERRIPTWRNTKPMLMLVIRPNLLLTLPQLPSMMPLPLLRTRENTKFKSPILRTFLLDPTNKLLLKDMKSSLLPKTTPEWSPNIKSKPLSLPNKSWNLRLESVELQKSKELFKLDRRKLKLFWPE